MSRMKRFALIPHLREKGWRCHVSERIYPDWRGETLRGELRTYPHIGNPAIQLYDEDGLPYATASVNPAHLLPACLIAIKDYAENNSLLTALEEAGIVARTDQVVAVGYACAYVCRVLI